MAKAVQVQVLSRAPNFDSNIVKRVWILSLLPLLAACAEPEKKSAAGQPAFRALGVAATVETSRNDEAIGFEIRRRFELIGTGDTAGIVIQVTDGVVTLSGIAPTLAAAWRAEGVARAVKDVHGVVNLITARNARTNR